jgi:hypothetical protein
MYYLDPKPVCMDPHLFPELDPDPHSLKNLDPDLHKVNAYPKPH